MASEDLVGPGQVEEVVHLSLALGQVDAQTVFRGGSIRLRRRRGRVLHVSLMLHGDLSALSTGIRSLLNSEYYSDYTNQ